MLSLGSQFVVGHSWSNSIVHVVWDSLGYWGLFGFVYDHKWDLCRTVWVGWGYPHSWMSSSWVLVHSQQSIGSVWHSQLHVFWLRLGSHLVIWLSLGSQEVIICHSLGGWFLAPSRIPAECCLAQSGFLRTRWPSGQSTIIAQLRLAQSRITVLCQKCSCILGC